jgi:hypothetical protein
VMMIDNDGQGIVSVFVIGRRGTKH